MELLRKHPSIEYFSFMSELDLVQLENSTSLIQVHFGLPNLNDIVTEYGEDYKSKFLPMDQIREWMDKADKVVIPLRDPLLCLMTANSRPHPADGIINGFVTLASWQLQNVFYVPVDLYANKDREQRLDLLNNLFTYLDLSKEPFLEEWAEWPFRNTIRHRYNDLYHTYRKGRFEEIRYLVPKAKILKRKRNTLQPFLESVGYQNLMWW